MRKPRLGLLCLVASSEQCVMLWFFWTSWANTLVFFSDIFGLLEWDAETLGSHGRGTLLDYSISGTHSNKTVRMNYGL